MKKSILLVGILIKFQIFYAPIVYSGEWAEDVVPTSPMWATEKTQLSSWAAQLVHNVKELTQLAMTVKILKAQLVVMFENGLKLKDWSKAHTSLNLLAKATRQGQAISYGNRQVEREFKAEHKDYKYYVKKKRKEPKYFESKYDQWSRTNKDTIADSLRIANKQHSDFSNENSTLKSLKTLSQSSVGRMQAIQAGNLIAGQQIGQIQKLRQLTMTQIQMHSAFMGSKSDKEALQKSQIRNFYKPKKNTDTNRTRVGNGAEF